MSGVMWSRLQGWGSETVGCRGYAGLEVMVKVVRV